MNDPINERKEAEVNTTILNPPTEGDDNRQKSEIVIGLVAPVGTDLNAFEELIGTELQKYGYETNISKLSEFLESVEGLNLSGHPIDKTTALGRYDSLMTA